MTHDIITDVIFSRVAFPGCSSFRFEANCYKPYLYARVSPTPHT